MKYYASVEGRKFFTTQLIAEIATAYYELLTLDSQLDIVLQNIELQNNVLNIIRLQKQSAKVTELAVKRFEAQVLDTKSLQYRIQQYIIETENKINFLLGRYPQPIKRNKDAVYASIPETIKPGVPAQLLENRPDIRQAELKMQAARLDIKVAKAHFYPALGIVAGIGFQAYKPGHILTTPESMMYSAGTDLLGPLVNKNAIKAMYFNANSKQTQAVINYERTLLKAYTEVVNQLANIQNLKNRHELKSKQVETLLASVDISNTLFQYARADYMEVLLTQKEALETRFELTEIRMDQLASVINVYRALGGGWQ